MERQGVRSEISAIKNDNRMKINITYSAWEADVLEPNFPLSEPQNSTAEWMQERKQKKRFPFRLKLII